MRNRLVCGGSPYRFLLATLLMGAAACVTSIAQAPTPAAQAVARAGDNILTTQDLDDLRLIDNCVLDTPLSTAEQEEARQNILHQFQNDPAAFTKNQKTVHQLADMVRRGSLAQRTEIAMRLWARWSDRAQSDPTVKWWVEMVRRHNPPIAQSGNLVVTRLQLNGLFADDDWVAAAAGLPVSTEASRPLTFASSGKVCCHAPGRKRKDCPRRRALV
jgi:hypothetical protein